MGEECRPVLLLAGEFAMMISEDQGNVQSFIPQPRRWRQPASEGLPYNSFEISVLRIAKGSPQEAFEQCRRPLEQ